MNPAFGYWGEEELAITVGYTRPSADVIWPPRTTEPYEAKVYRYGPRMTYTNNVQSEGRGFKTDSMTNELANAFIRGRPCV